VSSEESVINLASHSTMSYAVPIRGLPWAHALAKALEKLAEAHKKDPDTYLLVKPFEPYCLRHTSLTRLAEAGCDAFTLAKIAGHSSITITMRYCHPQADAIERAFSQITNRQEVVTDGGQCELAPTTR